MKSKFKLFAITFVVVLGLSLGGCNSTSEIPDDLHGIWNWSQGPKLITIVIDSTTIRYSESSAGDFDDNGSFTITVSKVSPVRTPAKLRKGFPNGYSLKGKITSSSVPNKPSGYEGSVNIYFNTAKSHFIHNINDDRTFAKK